jgi:DNA-binding LytR/AlgR family response regulator
MSGTMPSEETDKAELAPSEASSVLILRTATGTRAVRIEHIRQIKIKGKFTWVHLTHDAEPFIVLHTMKEMEQKISAVPQLVRCNQSCIANLSYCPLWKPHGKDARVCFVHDTLHQWHSVSRVYKAEFLRKWKKFYANP